jgi:hypothetical protein
MSLCYDFQKWTMITLGLVVSLAYGQELNTTISPRDELGINQLLVILSDGKFNQWKTIIDYCYQHAYSPNPAQDLVDKALLSPEYNVASCKTVKQTLDNLMNVSLNAIWSTEGIK